MYIVVQYSGDYRSPGQKQSTFLIIFAFGNIWTELDWAGMNSTFANRFYWAFSLQKCSLIWFPFVRKSFKATPPPPSTHFGLVGGTEQVYQ